MGVFLLLLGLTPHSLPWESPTPTPSTPQVPGGSGGSPPSHWLRLPLKWAPSVPLLTWRSWRGSAQGEGAHDASPRSRLLLAQSQDQRGGAWAAAGEGAGGPVKPGPGGHPLPGMTPWGGEGHFPRLHPHLGEDWGGGTALGEVLGWLMAAIYMGGRLPQIYLNIQRGTVEGLSPLMFLFALLGNLTYVGSILVRSTAWETIKPNLPWLVDAAVCVLLDIFILCQFVYYTLKGSNEGDELAFLDDQQNK